MQRRTLIRWVLSAVAALPFRGLRLRAQAPRLSDVDEATLGALAEAVLPSTLGRAGSEAVVGDFLRWIRGYREGAEMSHGYGITRLRVTDPHPAAGYANDLAGLRANADGRSGAFESLAPSERRELTTAALGAAQVDGLPSRPNGGHVASDLLSFYLRSSAANDLCYEAAIGRQTCRGLPGSDQAPQPL